jgi:nucleoside-diphosphate-sugar epimerase
VSTLILGCGYLGRRVGRRLALSGGEEVYGTVRSPARADELAAWSVRPLLADVLDPGSLDRLPACDRVFYAVGFDRAAGLPMRTVYVEGLRNALGRLSGRIGRWVYASSTGVYGQDDGSWVDEDSPAEPRHESGRVCLEAEGALREVSAAEGLHFAILRLAGLYGPGRIVRRAGLERGEAIVGDPEKFLNLIHVEDAARGAVAALECGEAGRIYNVAADQPIPRRDYYARLAEGLGRPAPRFVSAEPGSPEALRDEANKRVSNRRMRDELRVELLYPDVESGLRAALEAEGISQGS